MVLANIGASNHVSQAVCWRTLHDPPARQFLIATCQDCGGCLPACCCDLGDCDVSAAIVQVTSRLHTQDQVKVRGLHQKQGHRQQGVYRVIVSLQAPGMRWASSFCVLGRAGTCCFTCCTHLQQHPALHTCCSTASYQKHTANVRLHERGCCGLVVYDGQLPCTVLGFGLSASVFLADFV